MLRSIFLRALVLRSGLTYCVVSSVPAVTARRARTSSSWLRG